MFKQAYTIKEEIETQKGKNTKKKVKRVTQEHMRKAMEEKGNSKSKVKNYLENKEKTLKRNKYINKLNRYEVSSILKAKTRMIRVKANYKGMYNDTLCRFCKVEEETQDHILENCNNIDRKKYNVVTKEEIYNEELETVKKVAQKIIQIEQYLKSVAPVPKGTKAAPS